METKKNLPSLKELISETPIKAEQNDLNVLLNQDPPKAWIKEHPFAKGVHYLPIERVEYLLTRIFIRWWIEVKSVQVIANSIVVTVRLYYMDRLSEAILWQDGIGAAPIQTEKGAGAMEWDKAKTDAVMKAAPAAESFAVKDAAEKIGKLFGKDLNRKDQIIYDGLLGQIEVKQKEDKYSEIFKEEENETN